MWHAAGEDGNLPAPHFNNVELRFLLGRVECRLADPGHPSAARRDRPQAQARRTSFLPYGVIPFATVATVHHVKIDDRPMEVL
jgi:hypothetical protein